MSGPTKETAAARADLELQPLPKLREGTPLPAAPQPTERESVQMAERIAIDKPHAAETFVEGALERFPHSAKLNVLAGNLALSRGDKELAQLYLEEAKRLDQLNPHAATGLCRLALDESRPEDALAALRPALDRRNSLSPMALSLLEELLNHGHGAHEALQLTSSRPEAVARIRDGEYVDNLHRQAKRMLGHDQVEEGPGRFARTDIEKMRNYQARGIDRVAHRVAPTENPKPEDE